MMWEQPLLAWHGNAREEPRPTDGLTSPAAPEPSDQLRDVRKENHLPHLGQLLLNCSNQFTHPEVEAILRRVCTN